MAATATIKFSSPVTPAEFGLHVQDAVQHLKDCHERIERCLVITQHAINALADTEPVLRVEATAALDYELAFLYLLARLHSDDEEQTLFPRLRANLDNDPEGLKPVIQSMEAQHSHEHALFADLAASVNLLFKKGATPADDELRKLQTTFDKLVEMYKPQIKIENEKIIANCPKYLKKNDLDAMLKEMQVRFER